MGHVRSTKFNVKATSSMCVGKHRFMKACRRVEVLLHSLSTSALFESEWSVWRPGRIITGEMPPPPSTSRAAELPGSVWTRLQTLNCIVLPGVESPSSVLLPNHFAKGAALVSFVRLPYIIVVIVFGLVGEMNFPGTVCSDTNFCGRTGACAEYGIWGPDGGRKHDDYGSLGCDAV